MNQRGMRSPAYHARPADAGGIRDPPFSPMGSEPRWRSHHDRTSATTPCTIPNDWDRTGLPAWTYHSAGAVRAGTRKAVPDPLADRRATSATFPPPATGWPLTCWANAPWSCAGRMAWCAPFTTCAAIAARGWSMATRGIARARIVCPFHGWVYNLDGTLRGAAQPTSFGEHGSREVRPETDRTGRFSRLSLPALCRGPQPDGRRHCWPPMPPISPPIAAKSCCRSTCRAGPPICR